MAKKLVQWLGYRMDDQPTVVPFPAETQLSVPEAIQTNYEANPNLWVMGVPWLAVEMPKCDVDHSPPSTAKIKKPGVNKSIIFVGTQ